MLPDSVIAPLRLHLEQVKVQHQNDLALGLGSVSMPFGPGEKYPAADKQWIWQYIFPASSFYKDPKNGQRADCLVEKICCESKAPSTSGGRLIFFISSPA